MRAFRSVLAVVALVATARLLAQTPTPTPAPAPNAAAVLAAAREALGGEKKLAAVKTLVTTGRTRQVRGDNLVPIEFEIYAELPDKYVRKDEVPAQESGPTTVGFNGDNLIQLPPQVGPPAGGRPGGPPPPTPEQLDAARRARVAGVKQDFARLMLGLFAGSFDSYPLTFTYAGQAEAPQGMADVLDVKGPANLVMRLFVYRDTHLPVMVTWQGGPQPGPGRGPGPGPGPGAGRGGAPGPAPVPGSAPAPGPAPGPGSGPAPAAPGTARGPAPGAGPGPVGPTAGQPGRGPAPTPPPENRLYFADYRDVDGLKWPFRLRRAIGPDTIEETTFDRFRTNTKIDTKRFEGSAK
jgi:hypothetical protein